MTGSKLDSHRKSTELSQHAFARRAGVPHDSVKFWEAKAELDLRRRAPCRLLETRGVKDHVQSDCVRVGPVIVLRDKEQELLDSQSKALQAALRARFAKAATVARGRCGARTRKGDLCRSLSEPGWRRCRFHGGKSTGPRTQEGWERRSATSPPGTLAAGSGDLTEGFRSSPRTNAG